MDATSKLTPPESASSRYHQRLVVYVVWHPKFAAGRKIADTLWAHLNTPPAHPGGGGLGVPVLFRSVPTDAGVPAPVDVAEARQTAVVLLVDDEMVDDEGWGRYAEGLWDAAGGDGAHRVFPVRLSPSAFNLSPRLAAANYIRPLETPDGPPLTDDRARAGLTDDWDATLTRLQNAVVHDLCRLLRAKPRADYGSAGPAALPAGEKVIVFLSHTKADGVPVARGIKVYIEGELQLRTFFDANDIDYGADFDPVLRRAVGAENAALLVVQTDAYAGSVWCLEELLEAKRNRRPVLVVNAVAAGEERAPVYAGNVPTRRHNTAEHPPRFDRIVGRLLLEVLWRDHFVQQFEDVRALFGLPADVRPLPYPPEPLTLADLRAAGETNTRYVYPDPPLSDSELRRLEALDRDITLTTPLLLLATGAGSADRADPATTDTAGPTPRLAGVTVGLSVGNSPDLAAAGLGEGHLNEATVAFTRYLLACGADLAYGGLPQLEKGPDGAAPPNFLDVLLELVRAHNRVSAGSGPGIRLTNFVAEANRDQFPATFRARWKGVLTLRDVPAGVPTPAAGAATAEQGYHVARSLTAMRVEMTRHVRARVLLGGKTAGYKGKYPGLVEEAYLALAADPPRPVYLVGAFGGAARVVIDALEGRPTPVLDRAWQEKQDSGYAAVAAVYDREAGAGRAAGLAYDDLVRFFAALGVDGLSRANGLTPAENRRLFVTPHVVEMVYLVLLGLGRARQKDRAHA